MFIIISQDTENMSNNCHRILKKKTDTIFTSYIIWKYGLLVNIY